MKKTVFYIGESLIGQIKIKKNDIDTIYKLLNCEIFDCTTIKINNNYFDCYVDDMGLLVDKPIFRVISRNNKIKLAGNIIICKHNEDGEMDSLTFDDIKILTKNLCIYEDYDNRIIKAILAD